MKKIITLLAVLWSVSAVAQTYVRPSKGKTVTIFNAVDLSTALDFNTRITTAAFDWTAFAGVQITIQTVTHSFGTSCTNDPVVAVLGAPSASGTFGVQTGTNTAVRLDTSSFGSSLSYYASADAPYVKFSLTTATGANGSVDCSVTVFATPIPFTSAVIAQGPLPASTSNPAATGLYPVMVGGIGANDTVDVVTAARMHYPTNSLLVRESPGPVTFNTITIDATVAEPEIAYNWAATQITIQNQSTSVVYCGMDNTTSTSKYAFTLAAASGAANGTGGSVTVTYNGNVYCRTTSGDAVISYWRR